ncbi:LETM1-like protein [Radiomyces spectabilis]|uniref:LETM1-like protein n=1 Tax=Radiomyces spectabilis TaxID=64574 RepID=UPI00221E7B74|nr:LETM1-like protein [Radiomyces spectabilis]KAI8377594.1 LETM1-like protein [Radiomyces spectabilis]
MIKLIPFGIIFCILPESIPLWVIFLPGIVPSTCLKESQLLKQREKLDKVRQNMAMNAIKSAEQVEGISPEDFLSVHNFTRIAKHYNHDFELSRIDRRHLSAYCRFMGLQGWGTQGILKNRLAKHMNYLLQDDNLLAAEGVDSLGLAELQAAAEERGIRSIGATEDHLRRALKYWITLHRAEPPISPGLLVFSRMFLLNANYDKTKI